MDQIRRRIPGVNITVCDFGMSDKWSRWAEHVSDEFIKYPAKGNDSWFYKPLALLDSTFEYKMWIDIDCEVVGDISNIFDFIQPNKIAAAPDKYHSWGCKFQTGVFGAHMYPVILQEWADQCMKQTNRGDQEILWDLVKDRQDFIAEIPEIYNWLRIALAKGNDNPDKRIIHWTGPYGKQTIEQLIKEYNENNK